MMGGYGYARRDSYLGFNYADQENKTCELKDKECLAES